MLKLYGRGKKLYHSKFHARYSIFLQGTWQAYYSQITDSKRIGKHQHIIRSGIFSFQLCIINDPLFPNTDKLY
jgi:hypothetical protein